MKFNLLNELPECERKLVALFLLSLTIGGIFGFMEGLITFIISIIFLGYSYYLLLKIKRVHKNNYRQLKSKSQRLLFNLKTNI